MTTYKYGTVLQLVDDDPVNGLAAGDVIVRAGKLEDGDSYDILVGDDYESVALETLAVIEAPDQLGKAGVESYAANQYLNQQEAEA